MENVKTNEEFIKGMSEADWDKAEAIEAEINKQLTEGLSEQVAMAFVRTVMEVQTAVPTATVEGIFDAAMLTGLPCVKIVAGLKSTGLRGSKLKRNAKLSGTGL